MECSARWHNQWHYHNALRLSEPERTFIFGSNSSKCRSKNRKSDPALYSDKARSFNQPEHALYRNFPFRENVNLGKLWQGISMAFARNLHKVYF